MASALSEAAATHEALADSSIARIFHWVVSVATICGLGALFFGEVLGLDVAEVLAWVLAVLLADLMYVRIGKSVTLSMSLPVLLAAALIYAPGVAGVIAFLGCLDPRELRGKLSIERILFNRSQIALSTAAAGAVMHTVSSQASAWPAIGIVFAMGLVIDCMVNVAFVVLSTVLSGRATPRNAVADLWGTEPSASLALYASMSLVAPLFLLIFRQWGSWALVACTSLLLPFRLALTRIESLAETTRVVRIREAALADAQSAMAQRREERLLLAGDLHDEVLPALFKVHLMGEVLRQDLASGRLLDLDDDLPDLLTATNAAQQAIRHVMGDLRTSRSPIRNVARAIRTCADQLQEEGKPRIELHLVEAHVAEPLALCLLQVAREAIVNASRYSDANRISVQLTVEDETDALQLLITDDGAGFDLSSVDQASHFGLQLMRERVEAAGGHLDVMSSPGLGTVVLAQVPSAIRINGNNETTPPTSRGG
jgi:signal transduction histidine kinase